MYNNNYHNYNTNDLMRAAAQGPSQAPTQAPTHAPAHAHAPAHHAAPTHAPAHAAPTHAPAHAHAAPAHAPAHAPTDVQLQILPTALNLHYGQKFNNLKEHINSKYPVVSSPVKWSTTNPDLLRIDSATGAVVVSSKEQFDRLQKVHKRIGELPSGQIIASTVVNGKPIEARIPVTVYTISRSKLSNSAVAGIIAGSVIGFYLIVFIVILLCCGGGSGKQPSGRFA